MKRKLAIVLNILIIVFEITGFTIAFKEEGIGVFKYYTQDSNLLLLFSSVLYLIYIFRNKGIPELVMRLKYTATISVLLTFIVVLVILPLNMNVSLLVLLFSKSMLYLHTLCPILGVVSYIFLEKYSYDKNGEVVKSLIFTIIYGVVIILLNILNIVKGPYPFLMVYNQPVYATIIWIIVILSICYIMSYVLKKLNIKLNK